MDKSTKVGWKTTEFWVTAVSGIVAALVGSGVISMSDKTSLDNEVTKITAGVVALGSIWAYIQSRTAVKTEIIKKQTGIEVLEPKI